MLNNTAAVAPQCFHFIRSAKPRSLGLDGAHVAMAPPRATVPDLPLGPAPDQHTPAAGLSLGARGGPPPVGVAQRLASGPLPAATALPVV